MALLYATGDRKAYVALFSGEGQVGNIQSQMAELFDTSVPGPPKGKGAVGTELKVISFNELWS